MGAATSGRNLRGHLLPLGLWTATWAVFFATLLAGIDRLPNGDLAGQFHAFGLFQAREMAAGRLPVWSPGSYAGFPFAADTQSAVFYPPRWVTILLSLPWQFPYYALTLEALAHVWLAGVFTYFLAYDLTARRGPALLAALAFGLGGYLVAYPVQQLAILETMTWLPLVLLLLRRAVPAGPDVRYLLAAGLVLGLAALAGHPQSLLHAAYLSAAYFLFLAWRARWRWPAVLGWGGLFAGFAIGASAAALLPAARYAADTTRTAASYEFVSTGFPLLDFLQVIMPGALTVWSPQYAGLVTATLAVLAWIGRRWSGADQARSEIVFWSMTALVAAWLSLGDGGILFELAYRVAPGFALFRQQERFAGIFSLSLALLAAQGLAIWLRTVGNGQEKTGPRRATRQAILVVAGFLLLAGITLAAARPVAVAGWWWVWLRQVILLGWIALVLITLRARPRLAVAALLVLLAGDLWLSTRPTMGLVRESPAVFWPQPDWMNALQAENPGRIDSQNIFVANVGEIYRLEDIRGISPLKPEVVERYEALPRRLRWQLLNVTHVIASERLEEGLTPIATVEASMIPGEPVAATLYRFDDARPRAWLATDVVYVNDSAEALAALQTPEFDPARQVVLLAGDATTATDIAAVENPGTVRVETRPWGELTVTADTTAPAVLVISEWFRPGWRATPAAGESLPLLQANNGLMAIPLPAGQHDLRLQYRPGEVPAGFALSLVTLFVAIVLAARWRPGVAYRRVAGSESVPATGQEPDRVIALSRAAIAQRWLLVLILLAGFGLRVYRLGYQELRGDEAFNYNFTRLPLAEVIPELIDQGDPHSPLPYLLLNLWTDMAGVSELALRYLSVAAGTVLLAAVYALGRRMGGRATGLVAMGLAAVAPGLIWLSQDGRLQYMMVTLFSALATLIIVQPPFRRKAVYWGLYLAACLLTVYSHYYGVFALLAHGLYLWLTPGRRRDLLAWVACGVATAMLLGVWLVFSARGVLQAGHLTGAARPELARHLATIGRELAIGSNLGNRLDRWLFVGGLVLAITGAVALARARRTNWAALLLAWLGVGAYAMFLVRFSRGVFNSYYGTVLAPAWWLLISAGLVWLWRQGRWRRAAAVLAPVALGVAVLVALQNYYLDPAFSRTIGYRAAAAYLAERAGPDDVFVVPYPDPVWDYYLRDSDLPRIMLPASFSATAAETEATLAALAQTHERLWFVPYEGWDQANVVGRWLDYHLLHEERTRQGRTDLRAYRSLDSAGVVMNPVQKQLGDSIELAGAYLTINGLAPESGATARLEPGDAVDLTLMWQAMGPIDRSYTAFVHLLDGAGNLIAQHDGIPVEGTRPTTTWATGEQLLDRHSLVVPERAAGPLTLIAGLYDTETIERQPFEDGRTAWPIADLMVGAND